MPAGRTIGLAAPVSYTFHLVYEHGEWRNLIVPSFEQAMYDEMLRNAMLRMEWAWQESLQNSQWFLQ